MNMPFNTPCHQLHEIIRAPKTQGFITPNSSTLPNRWNLQLPNPQIDSQWLSLHKWWLIKVVAGGFCFVLVLFPDLEEMFQMLRSPIPSTLLWTKRSKKPSFFLLYVKSTTTSSIFHLDNILFDRCVLTGALEMFKRFIHLWPPISCCWRRTTITGRSDLISPKKPLLLLHLLCVRLIAFLYFCWKIKLFDWKPQGLWCSGNHLGRA